MPNIEKIRKSLRAIGIDLGTTNSTVAEVLWKDRQGDISEARCLEIVQQTESGPYTHILVPSFVALSGGKEWVGEGAKQLRSLAYDRGLEQNRNLFYECKNDMGIKRTYHRAPEGYRSAPEIGGRVLKFLLDATSGQDKPPDHVVVTVPASFQAAQRTDTLKACSLAGLSIEGGDLLDEPVAAFLDYIVTQRPKIALEPRRQSNLLVFDFGGGTCDVAILQVGLAASGNSLEVAPLAVSRYHRLGGGDLDSAILYEVLLPQILEQNSLTPFDLGYEQKKRFIEPAFIGIAEALKIGLCREIRRLRAFGKYDDGDLVNVVKTVPGLHTCTLPEGVTLNLRAPSLTAAQFENLLEPFLDRDLLYARETEYRLTCSIFAPLQDALDRSGLDPKDIHYCLPVGGSCLIPQVLSALKDFFTDSQILETADEEALQTMVARGAAYHSLSLAKDGRGLIRPVCHDTIAIRTRDGLIDLVVKGAELPYPADDPFQNTEGLSVPETVVKGFLDLRVEIVAKDEDRILMARIWTIPGPVNKGDPLTLRYRYDENQVLSVELSLSRRKDGRPFREVIENPITNVLNPQATKLRIDELEEDLRTGKHKGEKQVKKMQDLSDLYSDIKQHEKALEILGRLLRIQNSPEAGLLNKMAIRCAEMGDHQKAEKYYREAAGASSWGGPWFNLALLFNQKGKVADAIECVDKAIQVEGEPAYKVLRAQLAEKMGDSVKRDTELSQALSEFAPIKLLNDWQLGWYHTAVNMAGQVDKAEEAKKEIKDRKKGEASQSIGGELPQGPRAIQKVEG